MADERLSPAGIPVSPVYRPGDTVVNYAHDLADPGVFPFTRGVQPTMYRGRLWTMRQYAGFGTAQDTNTRFKHLLAAGQTGLSVAFDLPTQMGIDSDSPRALGEVGRVGVAIDSVDDLAILLDGIPLDKVSTSMTINAPAAWMLGLYVANAAAQGVPSRLVSSITSTIRCRTSIDPAITQYIDPPPSTSSRRRGAFRVRCRNGGSTAARSVCQARNSSISLIPTASFIKCSIATRAVEAFRSIRLSAPLVSPSPSYSLT